LIRVFWADAGHVSEGIGSQMDPVTGLREVAETAEIAAFAAVS
jgi:hypothetical protein